MNEAITDYRACAKSSDGSRSDWIDATRGLLMILVIVLHVSMSFSATQWSSFFWMEVSGVLHRLRMPVFFFISGLLASRMLARPWSRVLADRVANLLWLYLLWVCIRYGFFELVLGRSSSIRFSDGTLVAQLYRSSTEYWFIYALAIFFALTKLTRRLGTLQLVPLLLMSVLSMEKIIRFDDLLWDGIAQFGFFFIAGSRFWNQVQWFSDYCCQRRWTVILLPAWAFYVHFGLSLTALADAGIVTAILAMPAGISLGTHLRRLRVLKFIGRHTLPIYLTHIMTIQVICLMLPRAAVGGDLAIWLLVPASVVLSIMVAVALLRLSSLSHLNFLFALPKSLRTNVENGAKRTRLYSVRTLQRAGFLIG